MRPGRAGTLLGVVGMLLGAAAGAGPVSAQETGRLVHWPAVRSRHLDLPRNIDIWLPPGYDSSTSRYPVLYMMDGQNLFDSTTAFGGVEWGVDETLSDLIGSGGVPPMIVVGVWNSANRFQEYSPWQGAPAYARFLIEEVLPRVNREFRTRTGPQNTMVMGSSMGGLVSFYLVSHHPKVFGACGCLSTHFVWSEAWQRAMTSPDPLAAPADSTPYILKDIAAGRKLPRHTRYWFDYGTVGLDSLYAPPHRAVREWMLGQGLVEGRDFEMRVYPGASHNEASWRARLADPLFFLFGRR